MRDINQLFTLGKRIFFDEETRKELTAIKDDPAESKGFIRNQSSFSWITESRQHECEYLYCVGCRALLLMWTNSG